MRGSGRVGVGVVELVVALVLTAAVVNAAWKVFATQRRVVEELRERTEILDTDRAVRTVLAAELAAGVVGRDWVLGDPGVVELRAFRGWAVPCPGPAGAASTEELLVAYRGLRLGDPAKDSVLVLGRDGGWSAVRLAARSARSGGCPNGRPVGLPGAGVERWSLDPPVAVAGAVLLRLYERGSYHLVDGSLRYRRGDGGRQPLTPAALEPAGSGLVAGPGGGRAVLSLEGAGGRGGVWARTLGGNGWRP